MKIWNQKNVAVLYGGRSSERDVSLSTGKGCCEALRSLGYQVGLIDVDLDVAARLREGRIDVAFIALHGRYGEDGCIQGLLESMGIPYTGSGVLSSAMGMDKVISKFIFAARGLTITPHHVFPKSQVENIRESDLKFKFPVVIKPAGEGSSVGVHIVHNSEELSDRKSTRLNSSH